MKRLAVLMLALTSVTAVASASVAVGNIDAGAYGANVSKAKGALDQVDAMRAATAFLTGTFIAPANAVVRGDSATVVAQVADMACRVELARATANRQDAWRVNAFDCKRGTVAGNGRAGG